MLTVWNCTPPDGAAAGIWTGIGEVGCAKARAEQAAETVSIVRKFITFQDLLGVRGLRVTCGSRLLGFVCAKSFDAKSLAAGTLAGLISANLLYQKYSLGSLYSDRFHGVPFQPERLP